MFIWVPWQPLVRPSCCSFILCSYHLLCILSEFCFWRNCACSYNYLGNDNIYFNWNKYFASVFLYTNWS